MNDETIEQAVNVLSARVRTPADITKELGKQFGGDRDIYDVLGYPDEVDAEEYRAKYHRNDLAKRIIELPAEDTWKRPPDVVDGDPEESTDETEFEKAVERLVREQRLYHYCKRADIAAGIGEYGLLFIGFADGQGIDEPVNDAVVNGPDDVAYLTPFAQDAVNDWTLGREVDLEPNHPRYNQPVEYDIDFADVDDQEDNIEPVHWTRVIHIAEGLVESDLKGTPRLRPVYNRILDLEKVVGASAEMFWAGADRKFQFNVDADDTQRIDPNALSDLDDEVQKLVHDLEPYIKTFNTDMNVISGEDPDPSGVVEQLISSISGATGIPKRILTGSERGELASSQDRANWYGTVESRQTTFAGPHILRDLIDRFIDVGVLPEPSSGRYELEWPDLFELTDLEKAELQKERASALRQAAPGNATDILATPEQIFDWVVDGEKPEFEDGEVAEDDFEIDEEEADDQFNEAFR